VLDAIAPQAQIAQFALVHGVQLRPVALQAPVLLPTAQG
jgi:hypothetical protein